MFSISEQRITQLNIRLINSDDPAVRAEIEQANLPDGT